MNRCGKGLSSWLHENKPSWRGCDFASVKNTDLFASPSPTWMVWHEIWQVGRQYYFRAWLTINLTIEHWSRSGQAIYFWGGICKFPTLCQEISHFGIPLLANHGHNLFSQKSSSSSPSWPMKWSCPSVWKSQLCWVRWAQPQPNSSKNRKKNKGPYLNDVYTEGGRGVNKIQT